MKKSVRKIVKICLCMLMMIGMLVPSKSAFANEATEEQVVKGETETMSVYFDNSVTNWNTVKVYTDKGSGWPGDSVTQVDGKENVWEAKVPKDISLLIFNNNQEEPKQQSQDIKGEYIVENGEYVAKEGMLSGGKWTVLRKGENGELVEEVVPMQTIYYDNSNTKWETINLHYWGGAQTTWPGLSMEKTENGQYARVIRYRRNRRILPMSRRRQSR